MTLMLRERDPEFSGIVFELHTPLARGIFDLDKSRASIQGSLEDFFRARGVPLVQGFRPGIGATAGGPTGWLAVVAKALPGVGKILYATAMATRAFRAKVANFRKKRMRPFTPNLGVHLDIWPALDSRQRTSISTLMECLNLIPDLQNYMNEKHPGIKTTFLVTGNSERVAIPPIRIDSDSCSSSAMVELAARVRKGLESADQPTHFTVIRQWGVWERIREHRDPGQSFGLVALFP